VRAVGAASSAGLPRRVPRRFHQAEVFPPGSFCCTGFPPLRHGVWEDSIRPSARRRPRSPPAPASFSWLRARFCSWKPPPPLPSRFPAQGPDVRSQGRGGVGPLESFRKRGSYRRANRTPFARAASPVLPILAGGDLPLPRPTLRLTAAQALAESSNRPYRCDNVPRRGRVFMCGQPSSCDRRVSRNQGQHRGRPIASAASRHCHLPGSGGSRGADEPV